MSTIEIIKKIAEDEAKKLHILELGIVTSIFPHANTSDQDNYECNVKLKNRDLELRKVPIMTQHIGLTNIPNIGDLVLLAFINGDINAPILIGRVYNDDDRPPVNNAGEIIFESPDPKKKGLRRLYMKFPNGIILAITDDELKVEAGKSIITINTDGDITIESNAKLNITAKNDISISGQNITLQAQTNLDIKGGMVNIN